MPVILATQKAEIRRITVWSQPRQIVLKSLSWKTPSQKRTGGVAQGVGPEFKPQYQTKKKKVEDWHDLTYTILSINKGRTEAEAGKPVLWFGFYMSPNSSHVECLLPADAAAGRYIHVEALGGGA
jgi:hypothetical protein